MIKLIEDVKKDKIRYFEQLKPEQYFIRNDTIYQCNRLPINTARAVFSGTTIQFSPTAEVQAVEITAIHYKTI